MEEWVAVIARTWLAMVILYVMAKLLGKRQFSQLSLFEYMTGLTIGSIVVYIVLNSDGKWFLGVISMLVWVFTSVVISWLQLKSKRFRDILDGKSTVIIQNGRILEKNMRKERLTIDEMMIQLRNRNAFRLSDVEFAVMEPSGEINVLLKKQYQALIRQDMEQTQASDVQQNIMPTIVLMDGEPIKDQLKHIGKDIAWLEEELRKRGLCMKDAFVVEVNPGFRLHIDLYKKE